MRNLFRPQRTVLPPILSDIFRRVAIFQVGITIGFEIVLVLGAISAQRFEGTDRIYGVATTTIFALGQLVIALPVGKWMDRFGRRPVLLIGSLGETAALILIGAALMMSSAFWFSLGLVLLGLGSGAAQMAYLIGGDIYPPNRRAEGLGFMTTFISIGIIGGPYLVGVIGDLANVLNLDPIIMPWFSISLVAALASWLMYGLRPEPLDVARNPQSYYADNQNTIRSHDLIESVSSHTLHQLLGEYPIIASIGIMICFQGVRLSLVPLLTYILRARGYSLSLSSLMVAAMGIGMVLASPLVGKLGDKWGRKNPLLLAIVLGGIGATLLPLVSSIVLMFILLIILGVTFSTALTMTRVIITDVTNSRERGVALSFNSVAIGIAVVFFPTISSYILAWSGWSAMSWVGIGLMFLAFILTFMLHETGIGNYDHPVKKKAPSGTHWISRIYLKCLPPVSSTPRGDQKNEL